MADYINNVAAADNYTPACTLGPDFQTRNAVVTIANNPALMQFAVGVLGDWRWTDEREFFSIPQSFQVGGVIGVKVRNANPGQIARVLAVLSGPDDVEIQAGTPFTGLLSQSGAITQPGATVEGIVAANGAVVAGTGFTITKGGAGLYTVNFSTPFVSTPYLIPNPIAGSDVTALCAGVPTVNNAVVFVLVNGVATDVEFQFVAGVIA